jgi:leucine dehydrogenase
MMMHERSTFDLLEQQQHEQVLFCTDPRSGYRGIIAIHSTALGPAVGGTRYREYRSEEEALRDALALSRGMSYKNALAGLPFGGGKGVIFANPRAERSALFETHGRFVQRLGGLHLTAEDVGTTPEDMAVMRRVTPHVFGLSSGVGDPGPFTARGVFRALLACAEQRWGSSDLSQRCVAVQGVGGVGYHLVRELHAAGARIIVSDPQAARTERVQREFGAAVVGADEIYDAECDVFAPCALGGTLNESTITRLRVEVVVGAANNQLQTDEDGVRLEQRGITYGPDFVANAGGVLSGAVDILGWEREEAKRKIEAIYDTMRSVLQFAANESVPAAAAAEKLAQRVIAQASTQAD